MSVFETRKKRMEKKTKTPGCPRIWFILAEETYILDYQGDEYECI